MPNFLKFIKKNLFNLFLISIFIVRTPPLKIPFLSQEINSHFIYRIISAILFLFIWFNKDYKKLKTNSAFVIFSLFYFLTQSLSVINVINYSVFFINFEKLVSSILFLLVAYVLLKNIRKKGNFDQIIKVLIFSSTLNVIIQFFIAFFPDLSLKTILPFFHSGVSDIIVMNLQRNRLYFEFYDEIIIPILIYFIFDSKNKAPWRLFSLMLLLAIVIVSFISNVRTRFFVTLFVLGASFFIYILQYSTGKLVRYKKIFFIGLIAAVIFTSNLLVVNKLGYSIVDRFLLESKSEDQMTLFFRLDMLTYSYKMGLSHPLFGVGLGNFFEHLPVKLKLPSLSLDSNQEAVRSSLLYPHNIFAQTLAESGFLGLISILALIVYCLKKDLFIVRDKNITLKKMLVISFWGLFLFSLFNPTTPLTFFANFFLLRLLIETDYEKADFSQS